MHNKDIKTLSNLLLKNGSINKKVATYALSNLSRRQLAIFLRMVKRLVSQNYVTVYHSDQLSDSIKAKIKKIYSDKKIIFERSDDIKIGIRIMFNDSVTDYSVGGYVENVIKTLKSN